MQALTKVLTAVSFAEQLKQAADAGQAEHPRLRFDMSTYDDSADVAAQENGYLEWLSEEMLYAHATWQGLYSGLYSVNKKGMVPKPDKECLGQWIVQDIKDLREFRSEIVSDYWHTGIDHYEKAWYSLGDLMFKNFDTCHFKAVMEDVHTYCKTEVEDETKSKHSDEPVMTGACSFNRVLSNMQANVFALITQTSALAAQFQQEGWEDQDPEEKAYSYQQFGHTFGQFFVDLTGFKPTVLTKKEKK